MDTKSFLQDNSTPTKPCNVCGGPVKVDRTHVRRECLLFALERIKELEAEVAALKGSKEGSDL